MKAFWLPVGLLSLIFAFSVYNAYLVDNYTQQWSAEILTAETAAISGDWDRAQKVLEQAYRHWNSRQTYLHIVEIHGDLDETESTFLRVLSCTETEDMADFRMEVQTLLSHLRLLAETEALHIGNIL